LLFENEVTSESRRGENSIKRQTILRKGGNKFTGLNTWSRKGTRRHEEVYIRSRLHAARNGGEPGKSKKKKWLPDLTQSHKNHLAYTGLQENQERKAKRQRTERLCGLETNRSFTAPEFAGSKTTKEWRVLRLIREEGREIRSDCA